MAEKKEDRFESVLDRVNPARRRFLETLLLGSSALALIALPASTVLAQDVAQERGRGAAKGKAKGKGRGDNGKGKGAGKGKGRGTPPPSSPPAAGTP